MDLRHWTSDVGYQNMKAMILAAGFGTRLLPYTEITPKPLFTIAGQPLLDIIIRKLEHAGFEAIIINTHHHWQKIDSFLARQKYSIPVYTRYEPVILGTGGAIKNVADFWDDKPFMVINSDIVTNIDLKKVYNFHLNHDQLATMVLHDDIEFNTVSVNKDGFITNFNDHGNKENSFSSAKLAFTGIQVIDSKFLDFIPENVFSSSIDAYRKLIASGGKIKALISRKHFWKDIGTPEKYKETNFEKMVPEAFKQAWPDYLNQKILRTKLKGDGSDRTWYRLTTDNRSIVMADHGIRKQNATTEIDSFVAIGCHLESKGIPVPRTYLYDTFSGLVFMEDLGDTNFQNVVVDAQSPEKIIPLYKSVINLLIKMSIYGARDFDISWTYQTPYYDRDLILEKECKYFVDAFLRGYLGMDSCFEDFKDEFLSIADKALEFSVNGFMHRDMQSRNIMVKNNRFYFIDFQGGRIGPIQYDLASLLIDPYVQLPYPIQHQLLDFCIERLSSFVNIERNKFRIGYKYCAISRNLQILGAFGYLSRIKEKIYFEKYIPAALKSLKYNLSAIKNTEFPGLKSVVEKIVIS